MRNQRNIFNPNFQEAFDAIADAFGITAATAAALEAEKDEWVDNWQEKNCQIESQYE